jgi:uncharacterized protein YbbK (DUF523 family)
MTARNPSVLISACLMGAPVRYDGKGKPIDSDTLVVLSSHCTLVPLCPEMAGGFQVPRPPAEIEGGRAGDDVLDGQARVLELGGRDVTALFIAGAEAALAFARERDCRYALLIDGSPSCGSVMIYDGDFAGRKHAGSGVTAALLARHGIEVFTPARSGELLSRLVSLSSI